MEYYKYLRQFVGHDPIMLVGAGVIIYKENKVLLQRRADDLCWAYHGGSVELGETTEEAVRRELVEEIGVKVGRLQLFGVYSGKEQFVCYKNGDKVQYINTVYVTNELLCEPVPDKVEALECAWFDINSLPTDLHVSDASVLLDFAEWLKDKEQKDA